jgi:hypothetical protein
MGREEIPAKTVGSIAELLSAVSENSGEWEPAFPWCRGEDADTPTPLTPVVFRTSRREYKFDRSELAGYQDDENNLLQSFRPAPLTHLGQLHPRRLLGDRDRSAGLEVLSASGDP